MGALFGKTERGLSRSNEERFGTEVTLSPELFDKIRLFILQEDTYRTRTEISLKMAEKELATVMKRIGPVKSFTSVSPVLVNLWRLKHSAVERIHTELLLSEHRFNAASAALSMASEMTQTGHANKIFAELATSNNLTHARQLRDEYLSMNNRVGEALDAMQMIIFNQKAPGKTVKLSHHEQTAKPDGTEAIEMERDMNRYRMAEKDHASTERPPSHSGTLTTDSGGRQKKTMTPAIRHDIPEYTGSKKVTRTIQSGAPRPSNMATQDESFVLLDA